MKRLLIDATGSTNWIGGIYNAQGNVFSLSLNEWIRDNVRVFVVTNPEFTELFEDFADGEHIRLSTVTYKGLRERKIKLLLKALRYGCRYVYPNIDDRLCRPFGITGINFVPDYQYYHYPDKFPPAEYEAKVAADKRMAVSKFPLVLTGHSNLVDFRLFVSEHKENIYEIPFIAYMEKEVRSLDDGYVNEICEKYGVVPGRYVMCANQFWEHKNHITVFKALKLLFEEGALPEDVKFAFSGKLLEYRTDDHIEHIRAYFEDPLFKDRCICTGFVERREQLALMKGAKFIIQPSLFEGWGAALDDARVLDKQVVLSDIPVNHEHDSERCEYFDPLNERQLADRMVEVWNRDLPEDTERGIRLMYEEAARYSRGFERLMKEN